jgi:large subunit ribosomal protein L24
MHVKKNDSVTIMTGKDKGKSGKVIRAFPSENMVLVEGVNMKKVHKKRGAKGKGEIIEKAYPVNASNVKIAK